MQSDYKKIYQMTSQKTGREEQEYKDIGNFVFASLNALFRRPPSLILKLRGIGSWHLRRKRMKIIHDIFPPDFSKDPKDFESQYGILKHESKIELYNLFEKRLEEYDKYIAEREEIRKKRYESQILLKPE